MKTIRQIADEIGVSRQAVDQRIKKEPLSSNLHPYLSRVDKTRYVDVDGENLIKSAFSQVCLQEPDKQLAGVIDNQVDTLTPVVDGRIVEILKQNLSVLQEQLKMKDEQLKVKDSQLKTKDEQLKTLSENFRLQLTAKDKQIEQLTATIKTQAESINAAHHNELAETLIDGRREAVQELPDTEIKKSIWGFFARRKGK